MKLNENQRIIVTVLATVVIVGALGALNYVKFNEQSDLHAKLDNLKKEENKANDLIAQIPELRKKRADLANTIDQYITILPLEEHITHEEFAKIIDSYRRETQVVIQQVEYLHSSGGDDGDEGNFIRHRYRVNLIGSFPNFLRFINKIENHTRFLKIDDINVKPLGAAGESRGLSDSNEAELLELAKVQFKEITIIVSTYTYQKEEESAGR